MWDTNVDVRTQLARTHSVAGIELASKGRQGLPPGPLLLGASWLASRSPPLLTLLTASARCMPAFSALCVPSLQTLWPFILRFPRNSVAIVDAVCMVRRGEQRARAGWVAGCFGGGLVGWPAEQAGWELGSLVS